MPDPTSDEQTAQPAVRDIMARNPATVAPEATVMEAAAVMSARNIGAVVVCQDGAGRDSAILGILTERDLLRAAGRGDRPDAVTVADLMTRAPLTISAEATWTSAAEIMMQRGVRHLPVVDGDRPVGMLSVRDLMEHRSRYLEWLVQERTAALAEKNASLEQRERLMQFHLDVAGRIQRRLLPLGPPQLASFGFALIYHPLDQVSGDYYDFAMLPSGRLGILIADASGHGVPAAFVSVMAKTAFNAYALGIESPASVLRTMNHHLGDLMESERFITMFYGVLDTHSLRLTYASAGHPRPLWHRRDSGRVEVLEAEGPLIGFLPVATFEERSVQLCPGDTVLFYTDGVTEMRNEQLVMFGQSRLETFLAANAEDLEAGVVGRLETELTRFRGKQPVHDDVTCIGLSVHR